jgi:hypothetical protein
MPNSRKQQERSNLPQIPCHICNLNFESYPALAQHILRERKTHRKSQKWAASFNLKVNILNQKKDAPTGRVALTEDEKQNKIDSHRELSGQTRAVFCLCSKCNTKFLANIEVEFLTDHGAWIINKMPVFSCTSCRR